jgi:DNA-binding NarL/FixJ family response regulator
MTAIRVLLVDDHPIFRHGLRALLASLGGTIEVVGEGASGEEAVALAEQTGPDVVVMDLHMPGLGGVEATRRITTRSPGTGVLVLTMFDDDSVFAAMRAGALGYLVKGPIRRKSCAPSTCDLADRLLESGGRIGDRVEKMLRFLGIGPRPEFAVDVL